MSDPTMPTSHNMVLTDEQMLSVTRTVVFQTKNELCRNSYDENPAVWVKPAVMVSVEVEPGVFEALTNEGNLMVVGQDREPACFWVDPTIVFETMAELAIRFRSYPDLMGVENRSWMVAVNNKNGEPIYTMGCEVGS